MNAPYAIDYVPVGPGEGKPTMIRADTRQFLSLETSEWVQYAKHLEAEIVRLMSVPPAAIGKPAKQKPVSSPSS